MFSGKVVEGTGFHYNLFASLVAAYFSDILAVSQFNKCLVFLLGKVAFWARGSLHNSLEVRLEVSNVYLQFFVSMWRCLTSVLKWYRREFGNGSARR